MAGAHLFFTAFWFRIFASTRCICATPCIRLTAVLLFPFPRLCGTATHRHRWGSSKEADEQTTRRLGKQTSASGHIMHAAHACLVPVNYATTNVLKQLNEKTRLLEALVPVTFAACCCFSRSFCPICSMMRWKNITVITKELPLSIRHCQRFSLA